MGASRSPATAARSQLAWLLGESGYGDTDGHCFRDIEIETDKGIEEACSRAMERASEIERTGDVCCWEVFESSGLAEYVDSATCCGRLRS